jgi:hypothetical protein
MSAKTTQTQRHGNDGPHQQFSEALLAAVLVAIKELTNVVRALAERLQ